MATLGSQAVGSIVKLNVNGTARNFIVVHQGLPGSMYDASCNGTWLLMQDLYEKRAWDYYDDDYNFANDYANSDIHSYLNNTFIDLFDRDIKSVIKQVKLPYTNGTGEDGSLATGSSGISAKVFLLSQAEVTGETDAKANAEGAVLSHFDGASNSDRIAYLNGTATNWWLRSPDTSGTSYVWSVNTSGTAKRGGVVSNSRGIRPALVLPYDTSIGGRAITGSVNIGGVQRELTGEGYINIGGVLRELSDSQVNIGEILKSLKG